MSTQDSSFPPIAFSSTFPQQNFRLLELPPELLALIEARKDTHPVRLQFKSGLPAATTSKQHTGSHLPSRTHAPVTDASAQQGFLHLCSDENVWAVKQVSTSNTVFVTKFCDTYTPENDPDGDIDMRESEDNTLPDSETDALRNMTGNRGITTIAQVKNVLELIPVNPSEKAVEDQILSMVRTIAHADDGGDDSMEDILSKRRDDTTYSFQELLDNIPAPTTLCCRVAKNLFLIHDPTVRGPAQTSLVRPSLLLSAWKEFTQQCDILDARIEGPEPAAATPHPPGHTTTFGSVFQHMNDQHERGNDPGITDFASTLICAILRRFKTRTALAPEHDNETAANMLDDDWNSEQLAGAWDAEALTQTLGRWELQTVIRKTDSKSIRSDIFLNTLWKDLIPDAWHKFCSVNALLEQSSPSGGLAVESYMETVTDEFGIPEKKEFFRLVGSGPSSSVTAHSGLSAANGAAGGDKVSTDASSAADATKNLKKRKWHEKFGAQRGAAVKK